MRINTFWILPFGNACSLEPTVDSALFHSVMLTISLILCCSVFQIQNITGTVRFILESKSILNVFTTPFDILALKRHHLSEK